MTQTISRDELKAGLDAGTLTLIDALPESYYAQQHLPDKDAAIVTYCSNPACANSGQVATKLATLGYTNVRKYADGIQDWTEAGLPTESGVAAAR